jgi:polysaccharide deacetylase family protein (PEP-CTERM system associated)
MQRLCRLIPKRGFISCQCPQRLGFWHSDCNHLVAMSVINALSVDVEDYFQTEAMSVVAPRDRWTAFPSHVEANTEALFELFAECNVKATFFFLGCVADRFPRLVRKARVLGHEIGCHSYWHRAVFRLSPKEFQEDTHRAKSVIEEAGGVAVVGYRAPCFSITQATPWAHPILEELGFKYDSSVNPVHHGFYGNHTAPRHPYRVAEELIELPIATWRVLGQNLPVGGGAYLRILPYALVKNGVAAINKNEHRPAVLYLHPWEIDDHQPRLQASWKSRLRQYTGLSRMEAKLEQLLRQFKMGTVYESVYLPAVEELKATVVPAAAPLPAPSAESPHYV